MWFQLRRRNLESVVLGNRGHFNLFLTVFDVRRMPGQRLSRAHSLYLWNHASHWCVHSHPETAQKLLAAPECLFYTHPTHTLK